MEGELKKVKKDLEQVTSECTALRVEKDACMRLQTETQDERQRLRTECDRLHMEFSVSRAEKDAAKQQSANARAGSCVSAFMCVCPFVCMYVCKQTNCECTSCVSAYVCVSICMYACMYVCMYAYKIAVLCEDGRIHTYIHIYIHWYTMN